ncbi:MAG: polysaccharide deacetylase [Lachnospiraceae bacterium]|nr:polysaccharide deacetylase [Lachnospiraceae bacterium]
MGDERGKSTGQRQLSKAQLERRRKRRRKAYMMRAACVAALLLIIFGTIFGVRAVIKNKEAKKQEEAAAAAAQEAEVQKEADAENVLIAQAEVTAMGYDYDGAIQQLQAIPDYAGNATITGKIAEYEAAKTKLVPVDVETVSHVFFHTLVADPSITWNLTGANEYKIADYNQVMTTIDEFNKIMQQMYDRGYVLVNIRDLVVETTDADGNISFAKNENLMLPEGKKPFVLSQDDVSYYFYMTGDGYADKLIVGEDGKPTNEYTQQDGTVVTGSYDVVPCLDDFIEAHPDFSYKGAKGILALTGYNGVLGYRTDPDLAKTAEEGNKNATEYGVFDYQAEIEKAKPVVQALKDDGWEFASHSYGHISYGSSFDKVKTDADKWQERVANVIGPTDIIIYPFGTDIGSWTEYEDTNETYQYLKGQGFRFFCNVDSNLYWVQITQDYVRQGRINLDGYRMYQDIHNGANKLTELFDPATVFDPNRPTAGLDDWDDK